MRYDLLHPKALHKVLSEHYGKDYPVPKERQVRRWVSGDTPIPGWARRAIDEIMGRPPAEPSLPDWWPLALETIRNEENRPVWVDGAVKEVRDEVVENREIVRNAADALRTVVGLLPQYRDALEAALRQLDGGPQPEPGETAPGTQAPRG